MIKNNNHKKILTTSILGIAMTLLVIAPGQSFASPIGDLVDITVEPANCILLCVNPNILVVNGPEGLFLWQDLLGIFHTYLIDIEANTIDITEASAAGSFDNTELTISDIQWTDPPQPGFISNVVCTDLITNQPTTVTWTTDSITITIPASFPIPADIFCEFTAEHPDPDPTIDVDIDIKPGSDPNSINTKSRGVVPVAILGSDSFDVTDVDVTTLTFGPDGASPVHDLSDPETYDEHLQDVNDDGFLDLVSHYSQKEVGLCVDDTEATISGTLLDGTPFEGTDSVRPLHAPDC